MAGLYSLTHYQEYQYGSPSVDGDKANNLALVKPAVPSSIIPKALSSFQVYDRKFVYLPFALAMSKAFIQKIQQSIYRRGER